ncbi:MAG: hypothetical protein WCE44_15930 [Candidatus Velthaea sp.]
MSTPRNLLSLALGAMLLVPVAVSAQTAPQLQTPPAASAHHHRHGGIGHALKTLNLSPAQREQIAGIMKQSHAANKNADPKTRRANMKQLRAQINGVLTPDQQAQLKTELRKEHAARATAPKTGS